VTAVPTSRHNVRAIHRAAAGVLVRGLRMPKVYLEMAKLVSLNGQRGAIVPSLN
jgi:hypothetical protein